MKGCVEPVGIITYLRTDSTRVAEEAVAMASTIISLKDLWRMSMRQQDTTAEKEWTGKIQDAHEAIRPTNITLYTG